MSFASVFSRCRPARLRRDPACSPRAARLFLLSVGLLAVTLAAPASFLRADDQSPGSLDTTFLSTLTLSTVYTALYETESGTPVIFAAGDRGGIYDLNLDGAPHSPFVFPGFGSPGRIIYTAVQEPFLQPDDTEPRILVGGLFGKSTAQREQDLHAQNIARLAPDGTPDTYTFNPGAGANNYVTAILPLGGQPDSAYDGRIVVGGLFDLFNNESHKHLVRLFNDGSVDHSFADGLRIDDSVLAVADQINPATGAPNGSILIAGTFNEVGGSTPGKLARLDINGNLDTTFNPTIDTRVLTIAVQPDGKIVIGGDFTTINGIAVSKLARLNYDGTLDTTFVAGVTGLPVGAVDPLAVYVLKRLGDGRLYVGGNFTRVNGVTRNYLARINEDGTLDGAFDPGQNIINRVQTIAIQPDNKVLVGETLSPKGNNGVPASLVRLYGDPFVIPSPTVSITAPDPVAKESPNARNNGKFQFKRTGGDLTQPLTVYVTLSGFALQGVAYKPLKLTASQAANGLYTATFPAGQSTFILKVRPTGNALNTAPQSVVLTLGNDLSGANSYSVGTKSSATVTISDKF